MTGRFGTWSPDALLLLLLYSFWDVVLVLVLVFFFGYLAFCGGWMTWVGLMDDTILVLFDFEF